MGSQSIRSSWVSLRQAGANAREMLVQAAAQKWGVEKARCRAENNAVINTATNAKLSYGSLADAASKLPVPTGVALKDPSQFRIIGKPRKRLDTPSKVDGSASFGIDVRLPNMQYAVVARCPVFGGKVARFDAAKAKAVPGVKSVVQISTGVAVVADNTWSAMQGRRALLVQWDEGKTASYSTPGIMQSFADITRQPGQAQRHVGDAPGALASAAKRLEAVYEVPYLAHAPMEPLNCVADVRSDRCEVWASTQGQTAARNEAAKITGLKPEAVQVYTKYMGGGFGRRARADYIGEAVEVSKALGIPVKLTWSREDDLQQDWYRPASLTRFAAGLDADGWPVAFASQTACTYFRRAAHRRRRHRRYAVRHSQYSGGLAQRGPRHPGKLLAQCGLLAEYVLSRVVPRRNRRGRRQRSAGVTPAPAGQLAAPEGSIGTGRREVRLGQAAPCGAWRAVFPLSTISVATRCRLPKPPWRRQVKVHRVVCAVDCGHVVNPPGVEQQIQSGIVFGLPPR